MAELKTKATSLSVSKFLNAIEDKQKRADCKAIAKLMRESTGNDPRMWGSNMVGYGSYDYKYASGRDGTWFRCGFSPRAQSLSLYIMSGFGQFDQLMSKLGKYKAGKSCLYIKRLDDVDLIVLKRLIDASIDYMESRIQNRSLAGYIPVISGARRPAFG